MITRKMNQRISFFAVETTQNEKGDLVRKEVKKYACWAEMPKATTKEFRDRETNKIEEIQKRRNVRVFYIRKRPFEIDSAWLINWRGTSFKITAIEDDWQHYDMLMISAELIE